MIDYQICVSLSKIEFMHIILSAEKPGSCPAVATGRWVCASTCKGDSDCRGNLKCCKNRCGAMACQKPEVEVAESVEIPVQPAQPRFGFDY